MQMCWFRKLAIVTVPLPYIVVTRCGRICLGQKKINFSTVFAGQAVGIKEVHDDIWMVSFMDYDLGYFDLETRVLEPLESPFGPKCYLCLRYVV
jgi:putative transposase